MRKIFHITKSFHGGGGLYTSRLNDALVGAGQSCRIYCIDDSSLRPGGGIVGAAGELFDRGLSGVIHRLSKAPFHSFFRMREWNLVPKPFSEDIVHLQSITGFIGSRGLRHLLREKPRVFWTAHNPWLFTGGCVAYAGCGSFENECRSCPILTNPFKRLTTVEYHSKKRFMQEFDVRPIANSEWMAAMMRRSPIFSGYNEIPVVPPIVDAVFSVSSDRDSVRQAFGFDQEQFIVGLSASSLTDPGKGITEFFQTLPQEAKWLRGVTFLLIGDGRVNVPHGISAHFTGRVSDPVELANLYAACDLFVSPSFMETFGMAILEAQSCGSPVIAFETGGTPEAVFPECPCWLVPNHDFVSLHEAVEQAVSCGTVDYGTRIKLSKWVKRRHSANFIASKQIEVYQRHG